MRLTLRTLLAYMDGMLDPEDEKVLDAKIQESEFASDLVQRIRNAMKQLRLGAPKADAKGANDANLVADYLDGTLPEEQIGGFERMCLDSDLNLSEVAACHQILMRVLGEPAHVRPELRERIYKTPEVAAKAAVPAPPVQAPQSDEETITKEDMAELVAPAASTRSLAPAIGILTAAIVVLALLIWWPFGGQSPLAALLGGGGEPAPVNVEPPDEGAPGQGNSGTTTEDNGKSGEAADTPPGENGGPNQAAGAPNESGANAKGDNNAQETPADGDAGKTPGDAAPEPPKTPNEAPDAGTPADEPKGDDPKPPAGDDPPTPGDAKGADDAAADATAATAAEMGRYTNAQQLMLRLESDTWMRVGRVNLLREREQIACPPYYRPSIAMVNGVQLIFAGRSNATLVSRDENDTPTINLERGRVVLVTSGKAGAAAVLAVNERQAKVTFGDVESAVAIEVRDFIPPGAEMESADRQKVIEVFPLGGSITWTEADTELVIRPGQVLGMTDKQPVQAYALSSLPEWTDMRVASSVAKRAAETLEPAVLEGRPASLSLQEKVGFRQQETVALAIGTLCQIGEVEHAIRAFNNDKQHAYWPQHVVSLRDEIARSSEHAKQVRDALAAVNADDADKMYALIVGYSNAQLAEGKAAELVADLESDKMPLRVLAYENLRRITGRSNFYQAQKNAERQKDKIRFWKELGEQNMIAYPVPPTPLPNREPVTE